MDTNSHKPIEGTQLDSFKSGQVVSELEIIDIDEGSGATAQEGATIEAHYTGALVNNGVIFQSSHDSGSPITFGLNQVIEGWTKGVPGMKIGGKRRLIIPAAQAYGARSPSHNIPANSDLVFDIELISIK
jgi:peptidylprolyl isomerase